MNPEVLAVAAWLVSLAAFSVEGESPQLAQPGRVVQIMSDAGKCLAAPDQNNDGGRVQVWQCTGEIQKQWRLFGDEIRSGAGKCLDVYAPDQYRNGGRVQVSECNGTMSQRWHLFGNEIRSGAGKCLDVYAPDQDRNGAGVQVWDCNGERQQRWLVK
jgi:Ricin-type beta-trefoil lectin domain